MTPESRSRTKLTYADYRLIPEDGKRHEVIDGEHLVNPAPSLYHQTLSRRILFQLYEQIELTELGQVFNAPCDLQLSEHDIVQPDLIVVLAARRLILTPTKIKGVPDLVVEILSPSSAGTDRTLKLDLYQRSGVPEYWIVDPEEHLVEQYVLGGAQYALVGRHKAELAWRGLPDVRVDLTKVW